MPQRVGETVSLNGAARASRTGSGDPAPRRQAQTARWIAPPSDARPDDARRRARAPRHTVRARARASRRRAPTRNVRLMSGEAAALVVLWKEIAQDDVVGCNPAAARIMAGGSLAAVRDDMSSPRQPCSANAAAAAPRSSSQVSGSPSTARPRGRRLRPSQQRDDRRHPGFGRLLGGANPGQLGGSLDAAPVRRRSADPRRSRRRLHEGGQASPTGKRSGTTADRRPSEATMREHCSGTS